METSICFKSKINIVNGRVVLLFSLRKAEVGRFEMIHVVKLFLMAKIWYFVVGPGISSYFIGPQRPRQEIKGKYLGSLCFYRCAG